MIKFSVIIFLSCHIFSQQFGEEHIISLDAYRAYSVTTADLDSDGDIDVLSASSSDSKIAWYQNNGNGYFSSQIVISTNALNARSVSTADIDGDGDIDVLSASAMDHKIAWYQNDGIGGFSSQNIISTDAIGAQFVITADIDGDGDPDVLSASAIDNKIAWYQNDGIGNFSSQIVISTFADDAAALCTGDIDGDGDQDVLSASAGDDKIAWYRNDGTGGFSSQEVISLHALGARSIQVADFDSAGDIDVVSCSRNDDKVAWYRNNGNIDNDIEFSEQIIISLDASAATSCIYGDIDGDGNIDILSASVVDDKIAWYRNDGIGNFSEHITISTNADEARSVATADPDGDGDIDVLSASAFDSKIAWYENMPNIPTANFLVNSCYIDSVDIQNISAAYYPHSTISWSFGDGNYSNQIHPYHTYEEPGEYEITLELCNNLGCDTTSKTVNIVSFQFDTPQLIYVGDEITFENESFGFTNWTWLFGDGGQSLLEQPTHTYSEPGDYEVTVILTNSSITDCTFTETYTITVESYVGFENLSTTSLVVMPNPFEHFCLIEWQNNCSNACFFQVLSLKGEILFEDELHNQKSYQFDNKILSPGMYFFKIQTKTTSIIKKIIVQ